MVATAYTYTGNRTKCGTVPGRGTVAVDPRVIPLGSHLWVEGYGPGIAVDTGGAIRGRKVDLFMTSRGECVQFGRRVVMVRIEGETQK
jgi:3D (Asp-Asp-Asp) domain-containing protein